MLIQALIEYHRAHLSDGEKEFEEKPVAWLLEIDADGRFLGWVERVETVVQGKKEFRRTQTLSVPKSPVNRTSGIHPLLGCDDLKYIFPEENKTDKHEAFVALLRRAATETGDADLAACARFYQLPDEIERARAELAERRPKTGALVALSPGGPLTKNSAARTWWITHYGKAHSERMDSGGQGICLVDGRPGSIAPTHEKIKHLSNVGGRAESLLMSFDKEAFRSYGWEKNSNSPMCPDHAGAYVLALNDLLGSQKTRLDRAGTAFVYWTRKPVGSDLFALLEDADVEQVRHLLLLDEGATGMDTNEFYFLGIGGNSSRVVIRHWVHDSLTSVLRNVIAWFDDLRIADVFSGNIAKPPKIWELLRTLAREDPPAATALALYKRAIHGDKLGRTVLAAALNRMRIEKDSGKWNSARAGLIRLCVNDLRSEERGEIRMTESLDRGLKHPAYLCGRLLAVYNSLQYAAQGEVGVPVADRYFSLASAFPTLAFPKIEDLGMKHLRKLRGKNQGAAVSIDREIQSLHSDIAQSAGGAKFPSQLSLEDQGRFAIGFHHQRAESMARAQSRKIEQIQAASLKEGSSEPNH